MIVGNDQDGDDSIITAHVSGFSIYLFFRHWTLPTISKNVP